MSDDRLEVRYIPLDQAVLWDRNPKRHSIGDLDASFDRYGFKMPPRYEPHINGQGQGGIGAGNGRVKTLLMRRDQGRKPPRGVLIQDGQWLVPILFGVDAESQAVAEAFGIDDNNLTLAGGDFTAFDMARMWGEGYTDVLASLATADALPITVDGDALDALLAGMIEPGAGGDEFDGTPQDGPTRTAVGDLWQIGPHRLLVGDCTDPANVERLMGGEEVKAVITDAPYGIDLQNHDAGGARSNRSFEIAGDTSQDDGLAVLEWCEARNMPTVFFADPMLPWPGKWRQHLVWDKGGAVGGGGDTATCWKQSWELIQVARNKPLNGGRDVAVLIYHVSSHLSAEHVAAKPTELISYLIDKLTNPDDLFVDFFLGSGTSIIAAHRTGRRCYGCEVEPKYADVCLRRAEAEGLTCERI